MPYHPFPKPLKKAQKMAEYTLPPRPDSPTLPRKYYEEVFSAGFNDLPTIKVTLRHVCKDYNALEADYRLRTKELEERMGQCMFLRLEVDQWKKRANQFREAAKSLDRALRAQTAEVVRLEAANERYEELSWRKEGLFVWVRRSEGTRSTLSDKMKFTLKEKGSRVQTKWSEWRAKKH